MKRILVIALAIIAFMASPCSAVKVSKVFVSTWDKTSDSTSCRVYPLAGNGLAIDGAKAIRLIISGTVWSLGGITIAPVYAEGARDTGSVNYYDTGAGYNAASWYYPLQTASRGIIVPPDGSLPLSGMKYIIDLPNVPGQGYLFLRVYGRTPTAYVSRFTDLKIVAVVYK